ncbi:DUF6985 domain-containing protein [Microbulbifer halophilus]|uniref:DUF6985 domain-containing protein n=1 Tax=Microbulbifer halophilus TaxID=453963 RepID=A0ABW5EGD0_9GAMM|nr:hypothetical protein [Microbulbifer halophilus]MCW8128680.1 hypothetical protein [Microbulbifer halophilus]
MQLENLDEWLEGLRKEDDLLVGELHVPFLRQKELIEVCFVGQERAVTESQQNTLLGYLDRVDTIHKHTVERIFTDYQASVDIYRKAIQEWGEAPDENAPHVRSAEDLAPVLLYQSLFIPSWKGIGTFGMGFWAKWEVEHGVGLKFDGWRVSEAGENAVHFQF